VHYLQLIIEGFKGSRGQGFEDSSEMLKNYKELKARQKSYKLCLEIYRVTAEFPIISEDFHTLNC